MSIASEITRLGSLRDTIRSKLISAGIISNESAKLGECASAIDGMNVNSKVSKVLDTSTTSVAIPKGYHKEAGTVSISVQEKTKDISSGKATVTPDSGKVLKKVTVNGPTSYADTTQFASAITQDDDNTYFAVPNAGYYNTGSKIAAKNSNLGELTYSKITYTTGSSNQEIYTINEDCDVLIIYGIDDNYSVVGYIDSDKFSEIVYGKKYAWGTWDELLVVKGVKAGFQVKFGYANMQFHVIKGKK